jgi:hypothetical protein
MELSKIIFTLFASFELRKGGWKLQYIYNKPTHLGKRQLHASSFSLEIITQESYTNYLNAYLNCIFYF